MTEYTDQETATPDEPTYDPPDAPRAYTAEEYAIAEKELQALSIEGYLEIVATLDALQEQASLPEAGGFAFVDMISPNGAEVHFGDRAINSVEALKHLRAGIAYAMKEMGLRSKGGNGSKPAAKAPPPLPAKTALPAPAKTAPPARPAPATAQEQLIPAEGSVQVFRANRLVIKPMPNGRATVEFWGTNRKFADLMIVNWVTESIAKLFPSDWTPEHFAAPVDNAYELDVWWKNSPTRVTSKGNPYKDVIQVRYVE